jgi:hypothetical protein
VFREWCHSIVGYFLTEHFFYYTDLIIKREEGSGSEWVLLLYRTVDFGHCYQDKFRYNCLINFDI